LVASYAPNTKRAYKTDVAHFKRWGGRIPTTPKRLAAYLAFYAGKLAYATLYRRIAGLHREHLSRGLRSPARSELVRSTLRGIGRTYTRKQRQVRPILREHLKQMLPRMHGPTGIRDRALLLLGFLGAFRRSELSQLNIDDVQTSRAGLVAMIHKSKTDQEGVGRRVTIPKVNSQVCATRAIERWLKVRGNEGGPLFVRLSASGHVTRGRLSGAAIAEIVKRRVEEIGLERGAFSGHSLRAGFVTSAAQAGASIWQIKQQTGHKSDGVVSAYIRPHATEALDVVRLISRR
jgi:integrase